MSLSCAASCGHPELLREPVLQDLWRGLLGSSSEAACGVDVVWLSETVSETAAIGGLKETLQVALQALGAAQPEATAAAAAADPAEVWALALRRARALSTRRACGNPRCSKLEGASDAGCRGSKCSGCRLVRFCGLECSRQDWRWHKAACKALRQPAPSGGS